jgi:hypothetical protein
MYLSDTNRNIRFPTIAGGLRKGMKVEIVVSAVNNTNKTLVDDAATTLLRASSARTNGTRANAPAATDDTSSSDSSRGTAAQVTLSSLADVATRLQALNAQPDDTAKALADQLQQSNDALSTLDAARKSTASDRKAEAEQKLEQARKKLQLLQILGGDPATQAKQAKDIGKEIKDAAGEYNTALKDEAGGSAAASAPAANDPTAKAADADATTAASATATGAAPTPDATADPAAATAPTDAKDKTASTASDDPDTIRQQAIDAYQSPADAAAAKATAYKLGQHDRDVLALFKDAANQVKYVLDDAAQRAKAKNVATPRTEQAENETDKAIGDLAETIQIKQSGGDISGATGLDGTPAPVPVDILA